MKFVHMADMHFDTSFTTLTARADLGDTRRLEQRDVFRKIIDYIKKNNVEYFFIAGDLYEHEYIRQSTIKFINDMFKEIPNTKIFITPGNHDPYLNNSFYNKYNWNNNVCIFSSEIKCIETQDANIYGWGFCDFYDSNSEIENIEIKNKEKINILITHGTLNGSETMERNYNPIAKNKIEQQGFDYIALGHIHKSNYNEQTNSKIVYPGSTISMGFDELGPHGIIVGNIENGKNLELEFINLDNKEFQISQLDVTSISSNDEIAEQLNDLQTKENVYYKIELIGKRNFEIQKKVIEKLINKPNIIKIKDLTKLNYDINQIANENTLKGLFAKEVMQQKENLNQEMLEQILEIGLEILEK